MRHSPALRKHSGWNKRSVRSTQTCPLCSAAAWTVHAQEKGPVSAECCSKPLKGCVMGASLTAREQLGRWRRLCWQKSWAHCQCRGTAGTSSLGPQATTGYQRNWPSVSSPNASQGYGVLQKNQTERQKQSKITRASRFNVTQRCFLLTSGVGSIAQWAVGVRQHLGPTVPKLPGGHSEHQLDTFSQKTVREAHKCWSPNQNCQD